MKKSSHEDILGQCFGSGAEYISDNISPKIVKILVCYHKDFKIFENNCLLPIMCGRSIKPNILKNIVGDASGDNISHKNLMYSELTGMYWLWKNVKVDYCGIFHYRRFLDIKEKYETSVDLDKVNLDDYNAETIINLLENYDIILPHKLLFHSTIYEQYKACHYVKDLDLAVKIVKEKYPDYSSAVDFVLNSNAGYYNNLLITKKEIYNEYCEWLFDICEELDRCLKIDEYDNYQKRAVAFLSERLFNFYITHKLLTNPNFKIKEVNRMSLGFNEHSRFLINEE